MCVYMYNTKYCVAEQRKNVRMEHMVLKLEEKKKKRTTQ